MAAQTGRRTFLKWCLYGCTGLAISLYGLNSILPLKKYWPYTGIESQFYERLDGKMVRCNLCSHNCLIKSGEQSRCRTRANIKGVLYSNVYNRPAAVAVEPVEKEPLYHFLPGSTMLCIGTAGCNFSCKYCQNWLLSQQDTRSLNNIQEQSSEELIELAALRKVSAISFTYNEPTVLYEYMLETAEQARIEGLKVVMHSNGFINPEPLARLLPYLNAVTIDLKGFTEDFYQKVTGGSLNPVLNTLVKLRDNGIWFEVVNLLIQGLNDDPGDLSQMTYWLYKNLGSVTPLHFSRFFPSYRLAELTPTPIETMERARELAVNSGLKYVNLGNIPGHIFNSTFCPSCATLLVERNHIAVKNIYINEGKCPACAEEIPGIWL